MLLMFADFQKYLKVDEICIDNHVFKLHYKGTVLILLAASLLVVGNQYIGDPIDCMGGDISGGVMDSYCWIHSTFSIPERWVGKQGLDHVAPGVAPLEVNGGEPVYHKYYQWVCFALVLQAALFYAPRMLWKVIEGGRTKMLLEDMNSPEFVIDKSKRKDKIEFIVKYLREYRGCHSLYSLKFFFCEVMNFVNVVGQLFFMDRFLGNTFTTYGLDVLGYTETDERDRPDPMAVVFPKVTKCTFRLYGPSGTIEKRDGLCILPLNIINEKIYTFLWFWFIFVCAISGLYLVYRAFILLGSGIRVAILQARAGQGVSREKVEDIIQHKSLNAFEKIGEFFILYQMSKNLDEVTNKEILEAIHLDFFPPPQHKIPLKGAEVDSTNV